MYTVHTTTDYPFCLEFIAFEVWSGYKKEEVLGHVTCIECIRHHHTHVVMYRVHTTSSSNHTLQDLAYFVKAQQTRLLQVLCARSPGFFASRFEELEPQSSAIPSWWGSPLVNKKRRVLARDK